MAEKGFGVKEVNLIGASGTPTITSPNNLNLNAVNVAISTNASIGGNLTVSGTVGIAGTLTYEDVTNIDSVGIVTAREGVFLPDNKELKIGNTAGSPDLKIYHNSSNNHSIIQESGTGSLRLQGNEVQLLNANGTAFLAQLIPGSFVKLFHNGSNKFETNSSGVTITGTLAATAVTGDGSGLTGIAVTEAPVTDYTITGDGSHYYFHGGGVDETAGDPDLYLMRGQKYRFNNTTGSSHPFEFRIASGGSAYSNGVSGDDEGVQFFTVPYDAPAKIFYQCTIHGGMVGNIYIRGAGGQNDNVGLTTFTGDIIVKQAAFKSESSSSSDYVRLYAGSGTGKWDIYSNSQYLRITDNDNAGSIRTDCRMGVGSAALYANLCSLVSGTGSIPTSGLVQGNNENHALQLWNQSNSATYVGLMLETRTTAASGWLIANEWQSSYLGDLVFTGRSGASAALERVRFKSDGKVGINTDNPTAKLEISHGVTASQKSAAWMDQYDNTTLRIFHNQTARLGIYTVEQGDWSSGMVLGTIDGSTTRKWGIGMASNGKAAYASGLYIGYRADTSNTGQNTFNTMAHSLILPTTGDVRVQLGNLVIGTNNKGIAFSGSTSSPDADATSNTRLLSDYDEGTIVWELHRSDNLTQGSNHSDTKVTYTKIGNRVFISGYVYTASTGSSTTVTARLTDASGNDASLPYTPNHHGTLPVTHTRTISEYERMSVSFASGSKTVYVHADEGNNAYTPNTNNVAISSPQTHLVIAFTGSYTTDE